MLRRSIFVVIICLTASSVFSSSNKVYIHVGFGYCKDCILKLIKQAEVCNCKVIIKFYDKSKINFILFRNNVMKYTQQNSIFVWINKSEFNYQINPFVKAKCSGFDIYKE
jgi:hypothetical protein